MRFESIQPEPSEEPGSGTGIMRAYLAGVVVFLVVLHLALMLNLFSLIKGIF